MGVDKKGWGVVTLEKVCMAQKVAVIVDSNNYTVKVLLFACSLFYDFSKFLILSWDSNS